MSVNSAKSAHDFFKEKEAENLKKQNEKNIDIQLKTETINELRKQNNMLNEEKEKLSTALRESKNINKQMLIITIVACVIAFLSLVVNLIMLLK